ncbi:hypothetical protein LXM94_04070 [Rhizobium sp. TRM95111]|uniref:hypothetical protein n=1 Tax=Rhizobium alarense TaxID=2846851 RepID=UPI001F334FCD|nr:hypothetical protein [Rhizobium alarense]MCF3639137.1 hypothetical protein [Rhizobium alarense]
MRHYVAALLIAAASLPFATPSAAGGYAEDGSSYYGSYQQQCITKRVRTQDHSGRWIVKRVRVCS